MNKIYQLNKNVLKIDTNMLIQQKYEIDERLNAKKHFCILKENRFYVDLDPICQ